jgi:hypothetical protein
MVTTVQSPVSRKGSKVGSSQPLSPGARSNPSARGDQHGAAPEPSLHPRPQSDRRDRRGDEEQPEREQRERADSAGVLGLLKRIWPGRSQPQRQPYVFKNFPEG